MSDFSQIYYKLFNFKQKLFILKFQSSNFSAPITVLYDIILLMSEVDEKQLYLDLPLPQRTIAVALKHVFDQVKKLEEQENQEIQNIHQTFIGKFKNVEKEVSKIVKGGPIPAESLKNKQDYFSNDELPKVEAVLKANKGIEAYWLTVLLNFFNQQMTTCDKEIAAAILDISTNVTLEKLQLTFQLANNPWLSPGKYTRTFVLKEGMPLKSQGTKANWLKKDPEGILSAILSDNLSENDLHNIFPTVGELINEAVPYSLEYFLGAVDQNEDEDEQQDLEDDQEEDEEQEEQAPAKKIKK